MVESGREFHEGLTIEDCVLGCVVGGISLPSVFGGGMLLFCMIIDVEAVNSSSEVKRGLARG